VGRGVKDGNVKGETGISRKVGAGDKGEDDAEAERSCQIRRISWRKRERVAQKAIIKIRIYKI